MKRQRNSKTENLQDEKRLKEVDFVDEEVELRDKFLEELTPLPQESRNEDDSSGDSDYQQLRRIIKLEGPLPNLALPNGWMAINHRSGGIIYLHRATRVCTWARPYYLGKGSVRKHDVPLAAIPCLHQKKGIMNKQIQTKEHSNSTQISSFGVSSDKGSVLNFLNTAGLTDNQAEQISNTSKEENGKDDRNDQSCIVQKIVNENEIRVNGFNGDNSDGDDGTYGNSQNDGYSNSTIAVDHDCNHGNIKCDDGDNSSYGKSNDDDSCTSDLIVIEDDNNHGNRVVDDGKNSSYDNSDIVGNHSNHESIDNVDENKEIIGYVTANIVNTFHPKDGLDVVNDTLRVFSENPNAADSLSKDSFTEDNRISQMVPESLKPDICSRFLQDPSLKNTEKDELCKTPSHGNNFHIDVTCKEDDVGQKISIPCVSETEKSVISSSTGNNTCDTHSDSLKSCPDQSVQSSISKHFMMNKVHKKSGIDLIDADDLSTYIGKIFEFEELTIHQEQNIIKTSSQLVEKVDTALTSALECLPYCVKGKTAKENKGWVLNPGGKTPVAILHEYSQAVLKEKPVYVCSECGSGATPFMAEIQINGITYGSGVASSKKQAKQIAAEAALEVFLPDVFHKIRDYVISREELECFDKLKIDDPQVYEVSIKSGLPTPSQLLQECLKRNQGVCSSTINFKIVPGEHQNHSFKISCGKHSAEGFCKNKKVGKQLASQAILKKLHPHISTWGSLLRIYCDRPSSVVKKYKTDKDSLTNTIASKPDTPRGQLLLERLKEEMRKITNEKNDKNLADTRPSITTVDI